MTKFFKIEILKYCAFVVLIAIAHYFILLNVLPEIYQKTAPWKIYLLLVPIELLGLWWIYYRYTKNRQSAMKNFLFFMVVKMLSSLFFLAPTLMSKNELTQPIVGQFFVVFFLLLINELVFLVKMLNYEPAEIEKNEKIQE